MKESQLDLSTISLALQRKRPVLEARARIFAGIRRYFERNGFLEVSTPIRILAPAPEFNIDTEPCGDHFLIASPELQMKRMVAAGYHRIFQITRCFRQGERGERHLPEFTMLEWYEVDATMETLKARCQGILQAGAEALEIYPTIPFSESVISLEPPWHSLEVQDAFLRFAGWRPGSAPESLRFDMDLVDKVEPALPLDKPVFLCGYPASMASLARLDDRNPERALRLELYSAGLELANGFEELTDATIQRERFEEEEALRRNAGKPAYPTDEQFLTALRHGMPACAGMAMGLDRVVMLLTNRKNIGDVVAFS
jgi:elongation factor P--(R)-beta-lysine ligase